MKQGEEDKVREFIAKLEHEDQTLWRNKTKPLEEYSAKSNKLPIISELEGKNVIFVAEKDGKIAGLCWCIIVDRGVDKQSELSKFYIEKDYRNKGIDRELVTPARQLFIDDRVNVASVWTHHDHNAAIKLYHAGFKEVKQLVVVFVPTDKSKS